MSITVATDRNKQQKPHPMVYTWGNILICHKIEESLLIVDMDELWGHYAKWKKSNKHMYYMIPLKGS